MKLYKKNHLHILDAFAKDVIGDRKQQVAEQFRIYKAYKEDIIKQVAQIEYTVGNITKKCYEAMMNYKVEITD